MEANTLRNITAGSSGSTTWGIKYGRSGKARIVSGNKEFHSF
jgi:hypothetical protein